MLEARSMRFPADVRALSSVRAFAAGVAEEAGSAVDRDDLAVVVGELAANAAVHQRTEAEIVVTPQPDGGLLVEVIDGANTMPALHRSPGWDVEGHRGLLLVEVLSAAWGAEHQGAGKRVWARLDPARDRRLSR